MGNQISKKSKHVNPKANSVNSNNSESGVGTFTHFTDSTLETLKAEVDRQQTQHYLFKYAFQTSHFAPVEEILKLNTTSVLEIRQGLNPCWMNDIANDFPNCKIVGLDAVDPYCPLEPNCVTVKGDLFARLPFKDNSMDYVHQRMMLVLYPNHSVDTLFKDILRVTKPNGWIEMVEPELNPKSAGPLFAKLFKAVKGAFYHQLGISELPGCLKKKFSQIGLESIKTDYVSLPICWGGFIGKTLYEDLLALLRYIGPLLYDDLGIAGDDEKDQYEKLVDNAFDECVEYQTYFDVHWTIGRKHDSD